MKHDHITALHERERTTSGGFGCRVQNDCAERGPAHPCIGNADHVANALTQQLTRKARIPDFGHARIPLGATVFQDHYAVDGNVKIGVINACFVIIDILKDDGRPRMLPTVLSLHQAAQDYRVKRRSHRLRLTDCPWS